MNPLYTPFKQIFTCAFEEAPAPAPAPVAPAPVAPVAPTTFTQDQVDSMVAERAATTQEENTRLLSTLNSYKLQAQLSSEEQTTLASQITELEGRVYSATELAAREQTKITDQYTAQVDTITGERDAWQNRFAESTISRNITDAAVANKAYSPSQVSAILRGDTKLSEVTDESGVVTDYQAVVHFKTKDKTGAPVVLQVSPADAVKLMTEDPQYHNLFQGLTKGGLGLNTSGAAGGDTLASLVNDPDAYAAKRAALKKANSR